MMPHNINNLNIHYINLDTREDRKNHIEEQLKNMNWIGKRFSAIQMTNRAIGCSLSHLRLIENAIANNDNHILILEDDVVFTNPFLLRQQLNLFLKNYTHFDVVMLGGNNIPPFNIVDNTCIKINKCQTTCAYLVNGHYLHTLANNIKQGIKLFMENQDKATLYAIDKYWFKLQTIHNWFLITPLTVTQKADYSDIENKFVDYSTLMMDLNKEYLINEQKQKQKYFDNLKKIEEMRKKPSKKLNLNFL